ncbi:DUF4179 domain-containing protein [Bacillus sp. CGMCC 1.16607]|uniref:DUF4179 domain-containing protein n=1 Tax=Bacillus sp. CGMCC 1.16607 TaxID=3351842 RepID=UPI003638F03C
MDKWEQQLKKDVNGTLPSSIDQRIEETLRQLPRKNQRPKLYYGLAIATIAILVTSGLSFVSPAFANTMKNLPLIGSAFEFVGNIGVKKGKDEGLSTVQGMKLEIDGQIITFTETLYDGGEIHLGYLIESPKNSKPTKFVNSLEFFINSHPIQNYGIGGKEVKIGKGIYAGTINIHVQDRIPESFKLRIRSTKANASFVELPIERKGPNKVFLVNQKKEIEDLTIYYEKVTFFPTSTEISLRVISEEDVANDKYMLLNYQLMDEHGRTLQPFSGSGGGSPQNGKLVQSYKYYYEPLESIPKSITIKPYLRDKQNSSPIIERQKWEGAKLTLSQGEIGQLTILQANEKNGVTTFIYEVEGDDAYKQANSFWLEDAKGNRFDRDQPAERMGSTPNQYEVTFSNMPALENLNIATVKMSSPHFLENLDMTIELEK